ncbi:MAG: DUF6600 domain-containing protein, partial [Thermoanaerobaculia bacterium]|nr:DUF6600 domain-containing protein [Thermoanaerobaculia bacterium]
MKGCYRSTRILLATLLLSTAALPAAGQAPEPGQPEGYGYFRTVEGEIRLTTFDKAEPIEVEHNYPVLTGDRIWVSPGARVEMVLPDRTVIRAGGATDLFLESLALSADGEEGAATAMSLVEGEIVVTVLDFFDELEPIVVDTGHASVYLQSPGTYRLRADNGDFTEVVVRDGFAELFTSGGSTVVRTGEEAVLDGYGPPRVGVGTAASLSDLEIWGEDLDRTSYAAAGSGYVDPSLEYAAAPLAQHGTWVAVQGRTAWRPHVAVGWQPFTNGWWIHTPSGLSWVSYEPFGWVTSHYGTWALTPGWGWLWYPGAIYSPAWVYWYWGPTHVAWVPVGYYSHYYLGGPWSRWGGFRFGVYGWAGGSWDYFAHWTFCPVRYFGRRGYRAYWRSGTEEHNYGRLRAVPRGVITADTRSVSPGRWGKPSEIVEVLTRPTREDRMRAFADRQLPDVSRFVARSPDLSPDVEERIFSKSEVLASRLSRGSTGGAVKSGVATPFRPAPPLGAAEVDRSSLADRLREAEVTRGTRMIDVRRPEIGGRDLGAYRERPQTLEIDPSGEIRRYVVPERFRTGAELARPSMPPSGRAVTPRSPLFSSGDAGDSSRPPIVRRILEGIRSGEVPSSVRERVPVTRGDDGGSPPSSVRSPSPTPRQPTTR